MEEWIIFDGTARVDGEITYLRPNDKPELHLSVNSCDVLIEGTEIIKVRIGSLVQGITCKNG